MNMQVFAFIFAPSLSLSLTHSFPSKKIINIWYDLGLDQS